MLKRSSPAALAAALGSLLTFQGDAQAQADRPAIETTKVDGNGQRLHFPQRQSSVDVHRHQGGRDRHRSDRLRPADGRTELCRRDQEGHRQADQVSRSTATTTTITSPAASRSRMPARRSSPTSAPRTACEALKDPHDRCCRMRRSSNKSRTLKLGGTDARAELCRPQPFRLNHRHAPAEGEDHLRGRLSSRSAQVPGRGMIDFYPLEAEASIKKIIAMDWERLIPGHPGAGGRLGSKQDAQDQLDVLAATPRETVQKAARERQVLGYRREGDEATEVCGLARLREQPALRAAALLRGFGVAALEGWATPDSSPKDVVH